MSRRGDTSIQGPRRRSLYVMMAIVVASVLVLTKVFYIQIVEGEKWNAKYKETIRQAEEYPRRGDIYSRSKDLLVTSMPNYKLVIDLRTPAWKNYLDPNHHITETNEKQLDSLCRVLSRYIPGKNPWEVKAELKSRYKEKKQMYFNGRFNEVELSHISSLPILRLGKFKSGLVATMETKRVKPYQDLAARTLGNLSSEGYGLVGLEKAFDSELKGKAGVVMKQKLPGGYWVPMEDKYSVLPEPGYSLESTIDIHLQDIAHSALRKQLKRYRAHHGTAVLMEVETGDILAIANLTDTMGDYHEVYNYAVGESTEPGSTMKLASMMALLEDDYVDLDDSVDTENAPFVYATHTIRDSHTGYGKLSMLEVLKVSSNVGVAKTIVKYYEEHPEKFIKRIYELSLNEPLGLEIPGEPLPNIKNVDHKLWWKGSIAQMSYGYELTLTPLQILAFYNAIANDGTKVRPRFVKALLQDGKEVKTFDTEVLDHSICSRSTLQKAQTMLESVVDDGRYIDEEGNVQQRELIGTAYNLARAGYKIAGKTGTAQMYLAKHNYGTEGFRRYQASFVGYFPADEPKYSCIVVISNPRGSSYYGNTVAGEVFKEIADYVVAGDLDLQPEVDNEQVAINTPTSSNGYRPEMEFLFDELNIPVNDDEINSDWILTFNQDSIIDLKNRVINDNNLVPNVLGMGLKDALFILENAGLRVNVEGYGSVRRQIPNPGTRYSKNQGITIILK